jgi:small subunit ribosomal protein S1
VEGKYLAGTTVEGTIVRLTPFGAFVNLEPGIDGLVHISRLGAGRRVKHPKEVVAEGQRVEARVVDVDRGNKRISLSLEGEEQRGTLMVPAEGDIVDGTVERVMPYGVFLRLNKYTVGLLPNPEMGTAPGTNHNRMFPPGTPLKALVIEVNPENGRIRLSRTKMDERIERVELEEYKKKVGEEERPSGSLGSLGELLKEKLRNFS